MKPDSYKERWLELQSQPDIFRIGHLAKQIALSFLDHYFYNDRYRSDYIELLCEMANTSVNPEISSAASSALFGIIVEGLCDDFEELNARTYNRVMSEVISLQRKTPAGRDLDAELNEFGLHSPSDFFQRIEKIRAASNNPLPGKLTSPEKIIVLSRVTLGADVAITSIVIQHFQQLFPNTQIILLGGNKLRDLFGGHDQLIIRNVDYCRHGSLGDRLDIWHAVRRTIAAESEGLAPEKVMIVDPDSRLSQLGVFPLADAATPYLFFDSRGQNNHTRRATMAQLTNQWISQLFGHSGFCYPKVWLQYNDRKKARTLCDGLRKQECQHIITINFGVGGNERKQLRPEAETKLVRQLLTTPDTVVILDKGAGNTEQKRAETLADKICAAGIQTQEKSVAAMNGNRRMKHGLISVSASIGEMAALIGCSDEYIGYDSAGQHIAAAEGIPTCTIFAGSNNPDFVRRWCATGPKGKTRLVHVDTLTSPPAFDDNDIVARIIHARSEDYQS